MPKLRLTPQNREFYVLLNQAAANLISTAELLLDLLEHYPDRRAIVDEIKDREHNGDRLTHEIVQRAGAAAATRPRRFVLTSWWPWAARQRGPSPSSSVTAGGGWASSTTTVE